MWLTAVSPPYQGSGHEATQCSGWMVAQCSACAGMEVGQQGGQGQGWGDLRASAWEGKPSTDTHPEGKLCLGLVNPNIYSANFCF